MNRPKQVTLFQSWGQSSENKTLKNSKEVSSEQFERTSVVETGEHVEDNLIDLCDSFNDEDDGLLIHAEETISGLDCQHENHVSYDEPSGEANVCDISIGADGFTQTQQQKREGGIPGFDRAAGKLWIYPTNYPVRDYQFNIVQQCLFKNTMVTLPTGLGKTFIAAVVMYNFYRWYPQGKVIFMAPTKPLVAQQIEACYNIMGIPQSDTAEMTGSMGPSKRETTWHSKRVYFLTPQVLTNDLSRGSCPANDVRCLVIDEAHKALGNHAYCQVVRELVKYTENFRVLALSATPGSDIKAVQQVLSNLLISHIEIRTEESIDIKQYSHERKVEKIVVPLGDELTKVKTRYIRVMEVVVSKLKRYGVLYNRDTTSLSKFLILKSREAFRQNPPEKLQRNQYGVVEGDFALAMSLYHGFELLQLHGSRSLFNFLDGILTGDKGYGRTRTELMKIGDFTELMNMLSEKYSQAKCENGKSSKKSEEKKLLVIGHPKMERLQDIVVEHFNKFAQENGETRVMIFSQYRDSVQEITDMLSAHRPLVKVMSFIGQSSAGKATKGFTQKEQLKVMKQFREGGYNTLVSTCVGEEGLDIGDVDLIICFDAHKSPIRLVQRMGRTGRKREGRIVMLVTQGKEEQIYNQSQYSKRSIHKAILNGARSLHFYQHSPRMIPDQLMPTPHKMYITVKESFKPTRKVNTDTDQSKLTSMLQNGEGKKTQQSKEVLTLEDYQELRKDWFVPAADIPKLPSSDFICLSTDDQTDPEETSGAHLSLNEWIPWQNRLQETELIDHSLAARHLVDMVQFLEIQQTLDPTEDPYGQEMATYLNMEDVIETGVKSHGQASILSFSTNVQAEGDSRKRSKAKKRVGRSDFLPEIEGEVNIDLSSEEELPAFDVTRKKINEVQHDRPSVDKEKIISDADDKISMSEIQDQQENVEVTFVHDSDTELSVSSKPTKKSKNEGQRKSLLENLSIKGKRTSISGKPKKALKTRRNRHSSGMRTIVELIADSDADDFDQVDINLRDMCNTESRRDEVDGDSSISVKLKPSQTLGELEEMRKERERFSQLFPSTSAVPLNESDCESRYVIRTPPPLEEVDLLFSDIVENGSLPRVDLVSLVDEWENENRAGRYIVNVDNRKVKTPVKHGHLKMSDKTFDIQINTSTHKNTSILKNGDLAKGKDRRNTMSKKRTDSNMSDDSLGELSGPDDDLVCFFKETVDSSSTDHNTGSDVSRISSGKSETSFEKNTTKTRLSGSFVMKDLQAEADTKINNVFGLRNPECQRALSLHTSVNSQSIKTNNCIGHHNEDEYSSSVNAVFVRKEEGKKSELAGISHTKQLEEKNNFDSTVPRSLNDVGNQNRKSKCLMVSPPRQTEHSNDVGDIRQCDNDSLLDMVTPPPQLKVSAQSQLTFTQALACVHNIHDHSSSESEVVDILSTKENKNSTPSAVKCTNNKGPVRSEQVLNTNKLTETEKSHSSFEEDEIFTQRFDIIVSPRILMDENSSDSALCQEKDQMPSNEDNNSKSSSSSLDLELPQFDLGFDVDAEIIPPSPSVTQKTSQPLTRLLSQTLTNRLSQSHVNASQLNEETSTVSLGDKSCLENSGKSTYPSLGRQTRKALNLSDDKNNQISNNAGTEEKPECLAGISKRTLESEQSKLSEIVNTCTRLSDTRTEKLSPVLEAETSFDLLDDDFNTWIDAVEENAEVTIPQEDKLFPNELGKSLSVSVTTPSACAPVLAVQSTGKNSDFEWDTEDNCRTDMDRKRHFSAKKIKKSKKSSFLNLTQQSRFFEDDFSPDNGTSLKPSRPDSTLTDTRTLLSPVIRKSVKRSASTPLTSKKSVSIVSPQVAVSPFPAAQRDDPAEKQSDADDSFIVKPRRKKARILTSPCSQQLTVAGERQQTSPFSKHSVGSDSGDSEKQTKLKRKGSGQFGGLIESESDDDFDDSFVLQTKKYITSKPKAVFSEELDDNMSVVKSRPTKSKGPKLKSKGEKLITAECADRLHMHRTGSEKSKSSRQKRSSNPFIEEEAEQSEDCDGGSSDEADHSDLDHYEASFIQDFTQTQAADTSDMHAVYLNSVRSPPAAGRGQFKLQYDFREDIDVFSQVPQEEEEESQYMEDSFCVGSEEEDTSIEEDPREITVMEYLPVADGGRTRRQRTGVALETGRQRAIHRGRMKALDEIRARFAGKKQKVHEIPRPSEGNSTSKMVKQPLRSRVQMPLDSSSEDNSTVVKDESTRQNTVSKLRKPRAKFLSSSDEDRDVESLHFRCAKKIDKCSSHNEGRSVGSVLTETAVNSREERLRRQKQKQEEFRQKMLDKKGEKRICDEWLNAGSKNVGNLTKIKDRTTRSSDLSIGLHIPTSSAAIGQHQTEETPNLTSFEKDADLIISTSAGVSKDKMKQIILVDSKEISGCQDIVSSLRFKHSIHVSAASLPGCDYIVSNRMAVERKLWSEFSNGANRSKLMERLQLLGELYDRACLIVEKDRIKSGEEKSSRPQHWTKYVDRTLALLVRSEVKVFFTDNQQETAALLADLCQLEHRKNQGICVPVDLNVDKQNRVKFFVSIPNVSYVQALNLSHGFNKISDVVKSSVDMIQKKGRMSANRAAEVYKYIHRQFDSSMLPTCYK